MPNQPVAANNAHASSFPDDELGSLPEGWEERPHIDGRIFYIDHSTNSILLQYPMSGLFIYYSFDVSIYHFFLY